MTAGTTRCDPRMAHRRARPKSRRRGMAGLAASGCGEVVGWFRHYSRIGTAVTGRTPVDDPRMVHRPRAKRRRAPVTRLTPRSGGNMSGRRLAHDTRIGPVVTGNATGGDPRMVHCPGRERRRAPVTGLTGLGCRNMPRRRFAHDAGRRPVMTPCRPASGGDACMIERRRPECCGGGVTGLAPRRRHYVRGRLGHDSRVRPPVATCTSTCNAEMIHRCSRPKSHGRGMTNLTPQGRGYVPGRLAHDTSRRTAMTGHASACNPRVIVFAATDKHPCGPHLMAAITGQRRDNMCCRFAGSLNPVMAGRTRA